MANRKRKISVQEIMSKNYKDIELHGNWKTLIGEPERSGSWLLWGQSFNGKTSFCMQLAKELAKNEKVLFNSLEEGSRKSMKRAIVRNRMTEVQYNFHVIQETMDELNERLNKPRAEKIIFIDSLQCAELSKVSYLKLLRDHPDKLFIFISHAEGKQPQGRFAGFVRYLSDVKIRIEGYKAFVMSRASNDATEAEFIIWHKGAEDYWGTNLI
jgi:hypothetical protein